MYIDDSGLRAKRLQSVTDDSSAKIKSSERVSMFRESYTTGCSTGTHAFTQGGRGGRGGIRRDFIRVWIFVPPSHIP